MFIKPETMILENRQKKTGSTLLTSKNKSMDKPLRKSEKQPFNCNGCGKRFTAKSSWQKHMNCYCKGERIQEIDNSAKEKCYKCEICETTFTKSCNLKRHLLIHTGEKPFPCPHCEKRFSLKSTLQNHIRLHTGEKPYSCDICHKTFRQHGNYYIHRKTHNGEGRHICEVCGRQFIQKCHFELHLLNHTEVKSFACDHCNKRFANGALLKQHSKIHADERKVFTCHVCDKKLCTNRALELHLKAHAGIKDFQCKECGTTFQERNSLNRHIRQNEYSSFGRCSHKKKPKDKEYECAICLKKCKTKPMLRIHMYSHTGEKPFECNGCGKKVTTKSALQKHINLYCKGSERIQEIDNSVYIVQTSSDVTVDSEDASERKSILIGNSSSSLMPDFEKESITKCKFSQEEQNLSISPHSFASVDNRPVFSTTDSNSSNDSLHLSRIQKLTQHLHISSTVASVCMSIGPSEKDSFEGIGLVKSIKNKSNESLESHRDTSEGLFARYSETSSNSPKSEDLSIKDEIDIVHEDIDELSSHEWQ